MFKDSVLTTSLCRALIRWLTWNKSDFTEEAITPRIMSPVNKVSVLWFLSDKFQLRSRKQSEMLFIDMLPTKKDFFLLHTHMIGCFFPLKGAQVTPVENVCVCPQATGEVFSPGSGILRRWDHRLWCWILHVCCVTGPNLKPCVLLKFFVPLFSILPLIHFLCLEIMSVLKGLSLIGTQIRPLLAEQLFHSTWGF